MSSLQHQYLQQGRLLRHVWTARLQQSIFISEELCQGHANDKQFLLGQITRRWHASQRNCSSASPLTDSVSILGAASGATTTFSRALMFLKTLPLNSILAQLSR